MSPELWEKPGLWERLKPFFDAAMDKPEPERARFVDEVCGDDRDLREALHRLVKASGDSTTADDRLFDFHKLFAGHRLAFAEGELVLRRFRIVRQIGSGGMGEVYEAFDVELGRRIALKTIRADIASSPSMLSQFTNEVKLAQKILNPHVCRLHHYEPPDGARPAFLTMEFLEGVTLAERIGERGPMPWKEVKAIALEICEGLRAMHEAGIIHRDLKSRNVMLAERNGKPTAVIMDFGLAHELRSATSETASHVSEKPGVAGTVEYMAPEQFEGQRLTLAADIFALGVIMYEMATGKHPFPSHTILEAAVQRGRKPAAPSSIQKTLPHRCDEVVGRCLEFDQKKRYGLVQNVAEALQSKPVSTSRFREKIATVPKKRLVSMAALLFVALGTITTYVVYRSTRYTPPSATGPKLTDKDTVVLGDFDNRTGDPVFDDTLKEGLRAQLAQSPFLALISGQRVNEILKLMGRPAGDRLKPEVAREVCLRAGSKAMLIGSITRLGSHYVIGLEAVNCNNGDVLAEKQEQATSKERVLRALGSAASDLRSKLGESLSSIQKYDTPLDDATTSSLQAWQAYSVGLRIVATKGVTAALPFFHRAVELDPNFARAFVQLSMCYSALSEGEKAAENASSAYELRDKVSERERFLIVASYHQTVTGELDKAAQSYEQWQQMYPKERNPYTGLGYIYSLLGNLENALEEDQVAMQLDPNNWDTYSALGSDYANLNRLDEAEHVYTQATKHQLDAEFLLLNRYQLAFVKGNTVQMTDLASAAIGKPGAEDAMLAAQADTEAWHGRLENAREFTRQAMESARQNDAKETAGAYQVAAALREAEFGNRKQAIADAYASLKLAQNRQVRAMAALALARAGDTAGARKLADVLDRGFPLDTLLQSYWLPTIRAAIALDRKDVREAVELLKTAGPIELSASSLITVVLCPAYLRGEAYLMLGDGRAAASEFQKLIDHRGLVVNFSWGALARLGLARAYALESTNDSAALDKARGAYKDFFTLWLDADSEIPVLVEAKAETLR